MKKEKREKDNQVKYGTVSLPLPLINLIKKQIKGTGFTSVSSYVSFILRQVLSTRQEPKQESQRAEILDSKSEEEVREKLKALGYL